MVGTPADPPRATTSALAGRLRDAEQPLVRLELAGEKVPSLDWFIYACVRKEAVVSSQECTQATLVDLLARVRCIANRQRDLGRFIAHLTEKVH